MNKVITFFVLVISYGCATGEPNEVVKFSENSESIRFGVLVIPLDGCSGCTGSVIRWVEHANLQLQNFQIVFTRCRSKKEARLSIGEMLYNQKNVSIDLEGRYNKYPLVKDFPIFFQIENGSIIGADTLHGELLIDKLKLNVQSLR